MGAVSYTSGSGSFNVPSVVQRVWVSSIGRGGNGSVRPNNNNGPAGGGGGGWGFGAVTISSTTINYTISSTISICLNVAGGAGGNASGGTGGAGGGFSGSGGGNGTAGIRGNISFGSPSTIGRGGAAGGVSGSGGSTWGGLLPTVGGGGGQAVYAGGGGNGNNGFGGTNSGANGSLSLRPLRATGGNGGTYGGGGGGAGSNRRAGFTASLTAGVGGSGFVYVSWIDLTAGKTTLRSGETTTVNWNSPVINGSQQVSYTNTGTTNITRTFTVTDSRGAQSSITFTITPQVRIGSFTASPNPQTSGSDGIPNYNVFLSWSLAGATSFTVRDNTGATIATTGSSREVTNLPQSTGTSNCSNPGASRSYTLTATDGFNTVSSSLTVTVFNDNTPNNFSVPNRTGLEPDTFYITNIGAINGIDMATNVVGGPGVTVSKNNLGNFTSSTTITCNNSVQIRFRSDQFNTDPSGLPTAPRTLYVDIGPTRRFFTISTRAPIVKEIFNFQNHNNKVPYPDIDTIETPPDNPAQPFISTETLPIDDVELQNPNGVEFRTNNGNVQMRVKRQGASSFSSWQDVRQI
jgi:hypothetical protein